MTPASTGPHIRSSHIELYYWAAPLPTVNFEVFEVSILCYVTFRERLDCVREPCVEVYTLCSKLVLLTAVHSREFPKVSQLLLVLQERDSESAGEVRYNSSLSLHTFREPPNFCLCFQRYSERVRWKMWSGSRWKKSLEVYTRNYYP